MNFTVSKIIDSRASCPRCRRFVPWDALGSEPRIDPGSYYGISDREWTDCPKCGLVEGIQITPTKLEPMDGAA